MSNWKKILAGLGLILLVVGAPLAVATIPVQTPITTSALGNNVTTNYTIGFDFEDNDYIEVYLQEESVSPYTQTQKFYGVAANQFTITGGDPGTTVVMGTAPTTTQRVVIKRVTPVAQTVDYDQNTAFPADDHEISMDKNFEIDQEQAYAISKKIGLSAASPYTTPTMPDPVAHQFLGFNAAGTDLVRIPDAALVTGDILKFNTAGPAWQIYNLDAAFAAQNASIAALSASLTSHITNFSNPHSVTAAQVGNATAQWNASQIRSTNVNAAGLGVNKALVYDGVELIYQPVVNLAVGTANQLIGTNATGTAFEHKSVLATAAGGVNVPKYLATSRRDENGTAVVTAMDSTQTYVKLTSGGTPVTQISTISSGTDGQLLTIYNDTGGIVTIKDQSAALGVAIDRIVTQNGSDILLTNKSPASFRYDTGQARWVVDGSAGGGTGASLPIVLTTDVFGVLPVANGGTNSSTALNGNRFVISSGGAIVEQSALTASAPVRTDGSGLPTTGNLNAATELTGVTPVANGGTNSSTALNNDRIIVSSGGSIVEQAALTALAPVRTTAAGILTTGATDLASEVTGVLPLANGGTNKNMTAVNGGVVYTDADSQEVTAAGTSGQPLLSAGAGTPTWGTLGISFGGTGQTTQTAAFDALAPTTTKGDLIVHNGTDNIREPVGTNGQVLTADSTQASGVKWAAAPAAVTGDYWSGYTANGTSWSTTSTSFSDGTNSGGNAITTRVSNGLTVTAGASNVAGITWTPGSASEVYMVKASLFGNNSTNTTQTQFRLYDGTNEVTTATMQTATSSSQMPVTLSGIYAPGTASAVTLKLQLRTDTGGTANTSGPVGLPAIEWSIVRIK